MDKTSRFFIHFWLAVTIATLIYALYMIWQGGWEQEARNLFVPAVAFCWYLFRRGMYRRMKRNMEGGQRP